MTKRLTILCLTRHYPKHYNDPSGSFVRRWKKGLERLGNKVYVNDIWKVFCCDIIVCHWLWPASLVGGTLSLLFNKPLYIALYGDPFILERYISVRLISWFALKRAGRVQCISMPTYAIMNNLGWSEKTVLIPCR